jgi:hypothetical protein
VLAGDGTADEGADDADDAADAVCLGIFVYVIGSADA